MNQSILNTFTVIIYCILWGDFSVSYSQVNTDSIKGQRYYNRSVEIANQNPDSSIIYLRMAEFQFNKAKSYESVVMSNLRLGNSHMMHDRYDSARHYATIAKDKAGDYLNTMHPYYMISLYNFANVLFHEGAYHRAILSYAFLLDHFHQLPDSIKNERNTQTCYFYAHNQMAICYDYLGDFEESQRYRLRFLDLYKPHHPPYDRIIAVIHSTQASSFIDQHLYKDALSELRQCLIILDQNDAQAVNWDYIDTYFKQAKCYIELGKIDSANLVLQQAENLQKENNPRRPQVGLSIRGELEIAKQDFELAISYLKESKSKWLEIYKKKEKHRIFSKLLTQLADAHLNLQDHPAALHHYQLALAASHPTMTGDEAVDFLPSIEALQYPILCIPVLDKKAQALLQRNNASLPDRKLAQECYKRVDSLLSRTLRELRSAESRAFFSEEFRPIYERAIGNCYELYQETGDDTYLAQAFAYSERSKAILLSLALRDSKAKIEGGLPAEILEKEHQLRTDVATYRKRIFEAKATTDSLLLEGWRAKLFELEEDFRKLVAQMEQEYPNYYQVKYGLVTVTPEQVQANLRGKDHQLIAYFLGDSVLYQFVFSKEQVQLHKQPFGEEVHAHLSNLLPLLHTPDANGLSAFKTHASALYPTLLPQAYSDNPPETLTIIPDGKLGFLPFGVLLTEQAAPSDGFRELPYLLNQTQTSYGYSATLIHTSFRQQPTFTQNLSAFAPSYEGALRLSTNQPQATAVADQLGGKAYLAHAATEATFRQMAPDSRILHLAIHGMPDEKQALYAHLLFGPSSDSAEDGKLHAYELYNLSLNTQLVTLSACESGYGKLALGEGILSLARAFRYAGCQSILFSHWKVDGRAANDLLTGFYEQIDQGKRPSQAIWQAQNEFLATAPPDQVHPYYWANFVLTGEDEPLSKPFYKWWIGGGLILLLVVFFIFFRRK